MLTAVAIDEELEDMASAFCLSWELLLAPAELLGRFFNGEDKVGSPTHVREVSTQYGTNEVHFRGSSNTTDM